MEACCRTLNCRIAQGRNFSVTVDSRPYFLGPPRMPLPRVRTKLERHVKLLVELQPRGKAPSPFAFEPFELSGSAACHQRFGLGFGQLLPGHNAPNDEITTLSPAGTAPTLAAFPNGPLSALWAGSESVNGGHGLTLLTFGHVYYGTRELPDALHEFARVALSIRDRLESGFPLTREFGALQLVGDKFQ